MRRTSDAAVRNRGPMLEVLRRHVRPTDHVLEIASGTGQHAVWLAPRLGVTWQPSDVDPTALASVDAWSAADPAEPAGAEGASGGRVLPAIRVDVHARTNVRADVVYNANMIHIAPWSVALGLFDLIGVVQPRIFFLYGPFRRQGTLSPSNVAFDQWLTSQDPAYGVRDLETVLEHLAAHGYDMCEIVEMPANNLAVVCAPKTAPCS